MATTKLRKIEENKKESIKKGNEADMFVISKFTSTSFSGQV